MLADCTSASIPLLQPGSTGTWAPSRSPPVTRWSKSRSNDSVMILLGIRSYATCLGEAQPSPLNKTTNWRAIASPTDSGVGCMRQSFLLRWSIRLFLHCVLLSRPTCAYCLIVKSNFPRFWNNKPHFSVYGVPCSILF